MRTVAFYLPQFHSIPENDAWWGDGFTEWTNVRRATPQFDGHDHPRQPTTLGEYNLTEPAVYARQTELAQNVGIDAFCMYFYWFGGTRLLERPIEAWRQNDELLPYCLSWANESWTRRWDGKDREVLMHQDYAEGFEAALFDDLAPHFEAAHYLRLGGKPVFVVHRIDLVPHAAHFADRLRRLAVRRGIGDLYLIAAETKPGLRPDAFGMDAVAEFPPVGTNTLSTAYIRPLRGVSRNFKGRLMSYDRLARAFETRKPVNYVRHRSVAPGWDNTARRQHQATIYVGASPARYGEWLRAARVAEERDRRDDGLVFVNAWNEWAEGAYLEPDRTNGEQYLAATVKHVDDVPLSTHQPHKLVWSYPQLRSMALAAAGSVLAAVRRLRGALRKSR